jgi:hypothetical protein
MGFIAVTKSNVTNNIHRHTDLIEMPDILLSSEAYKLKAGAVLWVEGMFTENEIIEALTEKYIGNDRYETIMDEGECYGQLDACDEMGEFDLHDVEKWTDRKIIDYHERNESECETVKVWETDGTSAEPEPEYVQLEMGI